MLLASVRKLFNLIVIIGLLWPTSLACNPALAWAASVSGDGLATRLNSVNAAGFPELPPQTDDVNADSANQISRRPFKPGEFVQSSSTTTDTLIFTTTEHFTTDAYKDSTKTTAEWNISDGVLTLPRLSDAARQRAPSVAADIAGNTYVVWQDDRNGDDDPDIYAQKFDAGGHRLWPTDIRVNSDSGSARQHSPAIALDADGNAVVVWADHRSAAEGVYAQKLDTNGNKLWQSAGLPEDKRVDNNLVDASYVRPAAALDPTTGDIVVVWESSGIYRDIYAQRLKPNGSRGWSIDVRVNEYTDLGQYAPTLGVDSEGYIYVAWTDNRSNDPTIPQWSKDIYAQKLDLYGNRQWQPNDRRITDESINTGSLLSVSSTIAVDTTDNLYIAWSAGRIYTQKLDPDGGYKVWPEDIQVDDSSGWVASPTITLDGDGNVFVAWSLRTDWWDNIYDTYAQKLNAENGTRLWQNKLRVSRDPTTTSRYSPATASNPNGDIYVAWADGRSDEGNIYMQRLDIAGTRLWPTDLRVNNDAGTARVTPAIVTYATGNSYITWGDGRDGYPDINVYAQKLDANGNPSWPYDLRMNIQDTDVPRTSFTGPSIAADMTGTLAIVWDDNQDIYARTLNADGTPRWPTEVPVTSDGGTTGQRDPDVALDSSGNLYIVWTDYRNSLTYSDIYIQKFDPDRNRMWPEDRRVSKYNIITTTQSHPAITFDTQSDSLYVVWQDNRDGRDIYVQRLDLDGNALWAEDLRVNSNDNTTSQERLTVTTAGGYAYIAWEDNRDGDINVYAQKVASDGAKQWVGDVLVGTGEKPVVAANVSEDSYVVWRAWNNDNWDIFAQRLDPNGDKVWPTAVRINSDTGWAKQDNLSVSVDVTGNAYVAWEDYRRSQPDIYAQKLLPGGSKAWPGDVRVNPERLYLAEAEAQSLEVDVTSGNILWATLTVSPTLSGGAVTYYLSNNGGEDWSEVTPGDLHAFGVDGNDLRWQATLAASPDQTMSPVIDWLQIKYSIDPDPPNSVRVRDESSLPVPGAWVYHNGQFAGVTDNEGVFIFNELQAGDTLAALQPVYEKRTDRAAHDPDGSGDFSFRVYRTSLPINRQTGEVEGYLVPGSDQQHLLTTSLTNTLVLFNLVVSVEWDATLTYTQQISHAVQSASDYLYDLTDGQMAFGWVTIYDEGRNWTEADIQISTKNTVHPHAYIGGITSNDKSHVIRIGRGWDGNSGNRGRWDAPAGYRTLSHEFGHYALYLYDEYFAYVFDQNGDLTGEVRAYCTGPENRNPATDATNASVMDYQYTSSELSARDALGLWSPLCEQTAQWQLNGESPWETVSRRYADTDNPPRWQLNTPADREAVMAGPMRLPSDVLSLPVVTINNSGASGPPRHLKVYDHEGEPYWGAIVALYKQDGRVIGQGFTDGNGRLDVYGADEGDTLRAASFDAGLAGRVTLGTETNLTLILAPVGGLAAQAAGGIPHMRVVAEPGQNLGQIDLLVFLQNFGPGADPSVIITEPGSEAGYAPTLSYSPTTDTYEGEISFSATEQGMGRIRAVGAVGDSLVRLQSTYRLQRVLNNQSHNIYSDDGNLSLYLEPGSLLGSEAYFVVMPPGAVPGSLSDGLVLMGDPYDVTASGALVTLEKPGILTLRYDGALVNPSLTPEGLGIYRWDPNGETWQEIGGSLDEEQKVMVAPVTTLGTYALMAPPGPWTEVPQNMTFLPIILKGSP